MSRVAILETEVLIGLGVRSIIYYENLGYEIIKHKNKNGKLVVKRGTKILVKVNDLQKGSGTKVTKICDDCGKYVQNQPYNDVLDSRKKADEVDRCKRCSDANGEIKKMNVKYENSLEFYAVTNNKHHLLHEFSHKNDRATIDVSRSTSDVYLWDCDICKSEYDMPVSWRSSGNCNCPFCAGTRVNHTNSLWAVAPNTAKLLKDKHRGYELPAGSNQKEIFICGECGTESFPKTINHVVNNGLSCPRCSDGISYPEKFMFNLLQQIGVEFEYDTAQSWSEGKRYDFYLPEYNWIIETHGEQHYKHTGFNRSLEEEKENDALKEAIAKQNGIAKYIQINCSVSEMNYLKENILSSEASAIFYTLEVDWEMCNKSALKSNVKTVCDLWSNGCESMEKIGETFKLSRDTIRRYLKQGSAIGWCEYNSTTNNRSRKIVQLSVADDSLIMFWSSNKSIKDNLKISNAYQCCQNKMKTSGGFKWMYKEDYVKMSEEKLSHEKYMAKYYPKHQKESAKHINWVKI